MTRLSVLMAVFNGERYLREAIDSILQQEFTEFEFIVVNDGSTDGTGAIVKSYPDQRIRYLENPRNTGLTNSLNQGLSNAHGFYVARMDADDISLPSRLKKQVAFLDEHPEIGVLGCAARLIDEAGDPSLLVMFPKESGLLRWRLFFENPLIHPSVVVRVEPLRRIGGYDSNLRFSQDYDLWHRLGHVTHLSNLQEVLLYLRKHERSVTNLRLQEQRRSGIATNSRMISRALGREVSPELVELLWSAHLKTPDEARRVAELIQALCFATTRVRELSSTERKLIRKDAARRILALRDLQDGRGSARQVFRWAFRVDPLTACRGLQGLLRGAP